MPTSFLSLTTNTQASGSATTFLTWRLAMNDESNSNATKIDTFAQNISASVTSLQLAVSFAVNATESTTNNYVATVTGFTSYTNKKLINLMLDATQTGTTTLNINSLGTKTLYKIGSNGTAGNLDSGDLVAGRPNFFMYDEVGGYWLWVNGTSADQINIATTTNTEILLGSASGIVGSGISASSIGLVDGYYLTYQLSSGLVNERQLTAGSGIKTENDVAASKIYLHNNIIAGSGISLTNNTAASTIQIINNIISGSGTSIEVDISSSKLKINTNIVAGTNISLSNNISSSQITISSQTAASSIAPSTASYVVLGTDSVLTNERVLTAGSNISISNSASEVIIHNTSAGADGWVEVSDTWTYESATKFTIVGDYSSIYTKGMKFKLTANSVVLQGYILSATYSSPNTTVTVCGNPLTSHTFTDNYYSTAATPAGFPGWFTFDPAPTVDVGTYTSIRNLDSYYWISNKVFHFVTSFDGTTNNTPSYIQINFPVTVSVVSSYYPCICNNALAGKASISGGSAKISILTGNFQNGVNQGAILSGFVKLP